MLTQSGTYTLYLFGNGATTGTFDFVVSNPVLNTATLAFNNSRHRHDQSRRRIRLYVHGRPGERFFYNPSSTYSGSQQAQLFDPFGNSVFNVNWSSPEGPIVLTQTGTYTLSLFGYGATTGAFDFVVSNPVLNTATLAFNTPTTGTIKPGDEYGYTFSGTAGERFFFNPSSTYAGGQQAQLFDPFGKSVFNSNWSNPEGPIVLTQSGTYTLDLYGNGATTGTFDFAVSNPVESVSPLAFNTPVTATIANPGDEYEYTFSGTPGEQLYFNPSSTYAGGQQAQLFDPFGNLVVNSNWSDNQGPLTLTRTGTYNLILFGYGATTGTFDFQVLNAANQPAVTLAATTSGTLNPGTSTAIYQVSGTAGQRLLFHSLASGGADWTLYSPGDEVVQGANQNIAIDFTATLAGTGTYLLVVAGNSTSPVPYSFQVTDVSDAAVTPSGFGVVQSGTIAAGQVATFTYEAPAGLIVVLTPRSPRRVTSPPHFSTPSTRWSSRTAPRATSRPPSSSEAARTRSRSRGTVGPPPGAFSSTFSTSRPPTRTRRRSSWELRSAAHLPRTRFRPTSSQAARASGSSTTG